MIWNPSASRDLLDIAMSAVVVVALDGDAAARDVLAHALRRRIGTTRANELADKWAMLTFEEMRGSADPQKRRDKRRAYRPRWGVGFASWSDANVNAPVDRAQNFSIR